jgi:hypothetical protein
VTAQLLGDRFDLARRNALHIHLRQGRHQSPLRALVALEQLRREATLPILRNPELQLADPRDQRAPVMARPVAHTLGRTFPFRRSKRLVHFRFQHFLHHRADHVAKSIRVRQQNLFDRGARSLTLNLGHGGVPSRESGDVEHHQPAMTASLSEFAELSAHYPALGA